MRKDDDLTTFMCRVSRNFGALTSETPRATRPVVGLLYLYLMDRVCIMCSDFRDTNE